MPTPYHSAYLAHALTLHPAGDSLDSLSRSIANARVDLNPHQVDAALFAVRSPLSLGAILADEVGLGKTIEAGIVISQKWAERRRHILLILPATLRKQWEQELQEKFGIESLIMESGSYNAAIKAGNPSPFNQRNRVIICSYQFASAKTADIKTVEWDLVVVDEAHRLRNVYKPTNKIANRIAEAIRPRQKLLLTATPLQNSLLELYGLVSVIDPHVFGDIASFREQFMRGESETARNAKLKVRLQAVCQRTLRKQVLEYIKFTQRVALTEEFMPSDEEHRLYELVSAYLQKDVLYALPASQRTLMTLVLRKLLASSSHAIAGTLGKLVERLETMNSVQPLTDALKEDVENLDEIEDEWSETDDDNADLSQPGLSPAQLAELRAELVELRDYAQLAATIQENAKGSALLRVLQTAFTKAHDLGAARKAVIFTESRRTQQYLFDLLTASGYAGQIVMVNGTNTDPMSRKLYEDWLARHKGTDKVSGSRTADTKAALVESFRDQATILLATESAAEGVNLQFCSLVVNYDLPWNPQRVEQRIGRCHRYGQRSDVVVVNFLNKRNEADQRVYQLLAEKFKLFDGVFGASDEILGMLESGVDIEKRIVAVYQTCRTPEQIQAAFDQLQAELDEKISQAMQATRQTLLDNFDEEVHARLRIRKDSAQTALDTRTRQLLTLARTELNGRADFDSDKPRFTLHTSPGSDIGDCGSYSLDWRRAQDADETFFHLDHPLAQWIVDEVMKRPLSTAHLVFDYGKHPHIISTLEPFVGKSGWLELSKLTVQSIEKEEFLVFAARSDDSTTLDGELCRKLFSIDHVRVEASDATMIDLSAEKDAVVASLLKQVEERNGKLFDAETEKLDLWADDLKSGLEREIKELDKTIREFKRQAGLAASLNEKLEAQKEVKRLETERNRKRRELFDAQDRIDDERDGLIARIETQLKTASHVDRVFQIRWSLE